MPCTLKKDKPGTLSVNINTVLKNKKLRESFTWVFSPQKGYYTKGNCVISEKELNRLLPIEIVKNEAKGAIIGHRGY
jgi:hypothetical protein